ncbi:glycoside hydrolase family 7 protein [Didymella exigua CBS 183.55]|uniref:Glucanase n=1 Tax=Didymella exigua CBS 183.55 TaxID=1150837 RepID=A0A6A5RMU6_9PLEO|nr:glycoside hydrolase family 7 protein [Didymella exigua CBS 183.55]KAF1928334.1 glycoside hydrolase family 7 protein [Didymella exigua CBS 183.55]
MLPKRVPGLVTDLCGHASACVIGTQQTETHPKLTWLHDKTAGSYTNCYNGNTWNESLCSSNTACTVNCAIEGSDYSGTHGITTSGNQLNLKFITKGQTQTNEMFNLIGNEFSFDVDLSQLPCGLNGALYFVSMPQKGQGTPGYCDAQCARDLKYINDKADAKGWQPSSNDTNASVGKFSECCAEMEVWEANSVSTTLTSDSCQPESYSVCEECNCGGTYSLDRYAGPCDANDCHFNPYRIGVKDLYIASMSNAMAQGINLVMSLWDDHYANVLRLESSHPIEKDPSEPGVARGECPITSGKPSDVEAQFPNAQVALSNIKFGSIGSPLHSPLLPKRIDALVLDCRAVKKAKLCLEEPFI